MVLNLIENSYFLIILYTLVAIALYIYLYTTLVICNQKGCTKKKRMLIPAMCMLDCTSENWLLAAEAQQSPINIDINNQTCNLRKLNWENHDVLPTKIFLENNGETVLLYTIFESHIARVKGADLENVFNFVHISFRWGADHMLNGKTYPLEVQIMYHLGAITPKVSSRRLLIVAFLFEIGKFNESLELIISNFGRIRQNGSRIKIRPFPLNAIIPLCEGGFYCYIGTLTVPPYYEGIKWLVYGKPLSLSAEQLREFQKLMGADQKPIKQVKRRAENSKI